MCCGRRRAGVESQGNRAGVKGKSVIMCTGVKGCAGEGKWAGKGGRLVLKLGSVGMVDVVVICGVIAEEKGILVSYFM